MTPQKLCELIAGVTLVYAFPKVLQVIHFLCYILEKYLLKNIY